MKTQSIIIITAGLLFAAACNSSKKTSSETPVSSTNTKAKNGVYSPGQEELAAIQKQNPAVTMEKLQEGYSIYTGACTKCHGTKNIYRFAVAEWEKIMNSMAPKAHLNESQKDAVYQYVLAIKATQTP